MSVLEQNSRKRMLLGQDGNSLTLLIIFNAIIFVLLNFLKVIYLVNNSTETTFNYQVLTWAVVPSQPQVFATPVSTMAISYPYVFAW
jgi:uncharacterized integral membrane protein